MLLEEESSCGQVEKESPSFYWISGEISSSHGVAIKAQLGDV
jgi:hypothetical protein